MRRRAAVEPVIGHLKDEHRMDRNYLAARRGDANNAVLAAVGYNFRRLIRWLRIFCASSWRCSSLSQTARLKKPFFTDDQPRSRRPVSTAPPKIAACSLMACLRVGSGCFPAIKTSAMSRAVMGLSSRRKTSMALLKSVPGFQSRSRKFDPMLAFFLIGSKSQ